MVVKAAQGSAGWVFALKAIKFSWMTAILFWTIMYRLHLESGHIPDFIYVNF